MQSDVDVVVAGAGPTGLMLACELRLAGAEVLVLERRAELRETPKANSINGRVIDVLRSRGLLERIEAESSGPVARAPGAPFGNFYLNFRQLDESPLWGAHIRQPRLEHVLAERALELGASIRRGCEVIGFEQDEACVVADVRDASGTSRITARYLAGCDGPRSTIRTCAGIAFPGRTYPEVNRLGTATMHASVTQLPNGDLEVPGFGRVPAGFTRTERGVFAQGSMTPGAIGIQTTEIEGPDAAVDDSPMTLAEFQASIRRVLGGDIPLGEVTRLSRYGFEARQAEAYRSGRVFVAGDAAHQFPATGSGINVGMLDAVNLGWKLGAAVAGWAPDGLLDTYHDERHVAGARNMLQTQAQAALRRDDDPDIAAVRSILNELLAYDAPLRHMGDLIAGNDVRYPFGNPNGSMLAGTFVPDLHLEVPNGETTVYALMEGAMPVLLVLDGSNEFPDVARPWRQRVRVVSATCDKRPAGALLVRPDGVVAWAAVGGASDAEFSALRFALMEWFGAGL